MKKLRLENCQDVSLEICENTQLVIDYGRKNKIDINVAPKVKLELVELIFDDCEAERTIEIEESASVQILQFFMGSYNFVNQVSLAKDANCDTEATFAEPNGTHGEQFYDYSAVHFGARSASKYLGHGTINALSTRSSKMFIDFKKGAHDSTGYEHEDFILTDRSSSYHCTPRILCNEADVDGKHGFSAGHIDRSVIDYLKSRGLHAGNIQPLFSKSKIKCTIKKISDGELRYEVLKKFGLLNDEF